MPFWSLPPLPRSLPAALRDLDEASPTVRISAINDLRRYYDSPDQPAVVDALLRRLEDDAPRVRAAAAEALGEASASTAVMRLLVAIEDDDALVRQMALQALGQIGDERAAPRLRRALSDVRPEVRFQALLAYPKLMADDAETVLVAATRDADSNVRYIALRVLEERIRVRAMSFSAAVRAAAHGCLADDVTTVRVGAALLLAHGGDLTGASILVHVVAGTLTTKESEDEAAAVEAVGHWRLHDATPALVQRVYGPGRWFREQYSFLARISLAQLGHARARADILRDLNGRSRQQRTLAVVAAGRARLCEAHARLLDLHAKAEHVDPVVVAEALEALQTHDPSGVTGGPA